jgi:hypothetical protein
LKASDVNLSGGATHQRSRTWREADAACGKNLNRPQPCDAVGGFHVQNWHHRSGYLRCRSRNNVLAEDGIRRKIRRSCFYKHAGNSRNAQQSAPGRTSCSRSPGTILIRNAATGPHQCCPGQHRISKRPAIGNATTAPAFLVCATWAPLYRTRPRLSP